jgi:hypothetical protein
MSDERSIEVDLDAEIAVDVGGLGAIGRIQVYGSAYG